MSQNGKSQKILFLFATLLISGDTDAAVCPQQPVSITVVFNSFNVEQPNTRPVLIKKSFEEIPSLLRLGVSFVYKNLNSTFCDLGSFLSFVSGILSCDLVVLLLDDCKCEETFVMYLNILSIKVVSHCIAPYFTTKGASALLQRVGEDRQRYLLLPADSNGVQFYQDLSLQRRRHKKLNLNRTIWFGTESDIENQAKNQLKRVTSNIDNNLTSGAVFVMGFQYPDDFRVKKLFSIANTTFGKHFGKILWIFPVVHSNFPDIIHFPKDSQVLAFQDSIRGTVFPNHNCKDSMLSRVLDETIHVLESCGKRDESYEALGKQGRRPGDNCYVDVVQFLTDHLGVETIWKRIATLTGETLHACSSTQSILNPNHKTIFRVPVVEYFPYLVKHEYRTLFTSCPVPSLPCYGQRQKADNRTVINYSDRFCCTGWTVDVLTYLSSKLSYEFELYFQSEELYGVLDNDTGTWNGVIQDILSGKGDIAVDLGIRPDRCTALDCSVGYLFDGFNAITKLVVPKNYGPEKGSFYELVGTFQIFLSPFHLDLLITVLMVFNIFLFLIWATDKICLSYRNKRRGRKKESFTLLESTSYVWATAFGRDVGDSKKPLTLSARYLSSWLAFLALIFVNVYVARLMAEIVKQELPTKPFTNLGDPKILNNNLKLGAVRGSSMEAYFHTTRDPVLRQSFQNIEEHLQPSFDAGIEAVKSGILDGFIADTVSLTATLNHDPNCSLSLMGKDFSTMPVGFMFRKDWPWAEAFKLQELEMNENKREADSWRIRLHSPPCKALSDSHAQLGVTDMSGLFLILIFAIAYCCFSLVLENVVLWLVYHYRSSNAYWDVPQHRRSNITASSMSFETTPM